LVTKLLEKLQVLNNNIGMANVCNVPLNWIFMSGQGKKIFSLVSKKCRELNHLVPKLIVNNNYPNIPVWKKTTHFLNKYENVFIETGKDGTGNRQCQLRLNLGSGRIGE
jgi:hypothetical protein